MFTDVDEFQDALVTSGLPPLRDSRHRYTQFRASVVAHDLGPLKLIEMVTPAGECYRETGDARPGDEDLWQVDFVAGGRARVEQGHNLADLSPGDMVLIDPARPVRFVSTASMHLTMLMPRHKLWLHPSEVSRMVGVRIAGQRGPGALLFALAQETARSLTRSRVDEAHRSGGAVTDLLSVAIASQLGDMSPRPDETMRLSILAYIDARLAEHDLGPARIAAAHHISVRRLHRLFVGQPLTVAALIRQKRLDRCRAELVHSDRTVAAVAARWGFVDPSHFSRLFKGTYGYNAAALTANNRARTVNALAGIARNDGGLLTNEG